MIFYLSHYANAHFNSHRRGGSLFVLQTNKEDICAKRKNKTHSQVNQAITKIICLSKVFHHSTTFFIQLLSKLYVLKGDLK